MEFELKATDPHFAMSLSSADMPDFVIDYATQMKLMGSVYACPHGVMAWSKASDNLVETSTNLASVKMRDNQTIVVTTSQRSSLETAKNDVKQMVASVFKLAGASVEHSDGYPGWTPNTQSPILDITQRVFEEKFNEKPKVLAVHGGLECGLFLEKYPNLDMISFGPTIYGAHSPDERMNITTVAQFWDLLLGILNAV